MIIDFHNHLSPKNSPYRLSSEDYLGAMDDAGVDSIVILGKDYGTLGDSRQDNLPDEDVAELVRGNPDRFIGFSAVHPDRAENVNLARIDQAVQQYGLKGIKLNPASGFYPHDKRLYPVYEKACAYNIPVVIHMGIKPPSPGARLKYCRPVYLDDVVVDFPDLKIVIAHAAYPWVEETIAVGLYSENVFVDISTLNQIEDSLGYEVMQPTLHKLVSSLGSGRVVFGSDGIFNFDPLIKLVRSAPFLTDADRDRIFWKNAQGILGACAAAGNQ